eukprot:tig00000658_g2918.t1
MASSTRRPASASVVTAASLGLDASRPPIDERHSDKARYAWGGEIAGAAVYKPREAPKFRALSAGAKSMFVGGTSYSRNTPAPPEQTLPAHPKTYEDTFSATVQSLPSEAAPSRNISTAPARLGSTLGPPTQHFPFGAYHVPGYTGLVPRIGEVSDGVGKPKPYTEATADALALFEAARRKKGNNNGVPENVPVLGRRAMNDRLERLQQAFERSQRKLADDTAAVNRMIAGYGGHVHGFQNAHARTFGDAVRHLEANPPTVDPGPLCDTFASQRGVLGVGDGAPPEKPQLPPAGDDYVLAGYGGHVPGLRDAAGPTQGDYTRGYLQRRRAGYDIASAAGSSAHGEDASHRSSLPLGPRYNGIPRNQVPKPWQVRYIPGYAGSIPNRNFYYGRDYYKEASLARDGVPPPYPPKLVERELQPGSWKAEPVGYTGCVPRDAKARPSQTQVLEASAMVGEVSTRPRPQHTQPAPPRGPQLAHE